MRLSGQPGLGNRPPNVPLFRVSGGDHGLVFTQSSALERVYDDRCESEVLKYEQYGVPEIFNTDQDSQFTGNDFNGVLKSLYIKIRMEGRGRWVDNVFVEHLWRNVKYGEVYLKVYDRVNDARRSLWAYFDFYDSNRRYQSLDQLTLDTVYFQSVARVDA